MIEWTPMTCECRSEDGSGCRDIWVEWNSVAREFCHGCGRACNMDNVMVNPEGHPSVFRLEDDRVLVVFFEKEEV